MVLSNWDKRLLVKHLGAYKNLANGKRLPKSKNEISFVAFIKNNTKPNSKPNLSIYVWLLFIQKNFLLRIRNEDVELQFRWFWCDNI